MRSRATRTLSDWSVSQITAGQRLFRGSWHVGFAWEKVAWRRPGAGSLGPARAGAARLIRSTVAC